MNKENALKLNEKEFNENFDFKDETNIPYEGGLLVAAQLKNRKKYDITVLKPDEINRYFLAMLKKISNNKETFIKEKFVLTGAHWVAGYIEIKNGEVNLFIPDIATIGRQWSPQRQLIEGLQQTFVNQSCNVYIGAEKRQYTMAGCSSYALDDVQHLFTLDKYLPQNSNIFDYLKKNVQQEKTVENNVKVLLSKTPLHLMRVKTSRELEKDIASRPDEEKNAPLNKKGHTAQNEYDRDFKEEGLVPTKKINKRLQRKRLQMQKNNKNYIESVQESYLESDLKGCTLSGFIDRLSNNNFKSDLRHGQSIEIKQDIKKAEPVKDGSPSSPIFETKTVANTSDVLDLKTFNPKGSEAILPVSHDSIISERKPTRSESTDETRQELISLSSDLNNYTSKKGENLKLVKATELAIESAVDRIASSYSSKAQTKLSVNEAGFILKAFIHLIVSFFKQPLFGQAFFAATLASNQGRPYRPSSPPQNFSAQTPFLATLNKHSHLPNYEARFSRMV